MAEGLQVGVQKHLQNLNFIALNGNMFLDTVGQIPSVNELKACMVTKSLQTAIGLSQTGNPSRGHKGEPFLLKFAEDCKLQDIASCNTENSYIYAERLS